MTSSLDMIRGRSNVVTLTNKSGGALVAGDVCIIDTSNDEAATTTTSAASVLKVYIAAESIANDATGKFYSAGFCPLVTPSASVTRGRYLFTHTVAKQAAENATYGAGAFGVILKSGTMPSVWLFGTTAQGSGGGGDVATDPIWDAAGDLAVGTGADTATRLAAGNAGAVLAMGNSAVIWNAGTSFPGSKATGDRYWRTDLGLEFYWNGTRWLSTTLYICDLPPYQVSGAVQPISASASGFHRAVVMTDLYDMWVVDFRVNARVAATNNGSNYWTISLIALAGGATLGTLNTSAISAATVSRIVASAGALVGASNIQVYTDCSKVSSPGNLDIFTAQFTYRLVGT